MRPRRAARWQSRLWLTCAVVLAGCASAPLPEPDASRGPGGEAPERPRLSDGAPAAPEPSRGEVLARGERFIVYRPASGDTLKTISARFLGSDARDWTIAELNGIDRVTAGKPLAVPLKPVNPLGIRRGQVQTVPILCYHRFGTGGGRLSVTPGNFAQQLDWLSRNDYHVVRLSQLMAFLDGREPLPRRSVVITIDDGYESAYRHAWPLLRQHGFPATLFIYTDFIGSADAMSWGQLREMVDTGLVELGAHSKSHRNLVERGSGLSDAQYRQGLEMEARAPRDVLEARLPVQVRSFAFPYGDANPAVLEAIKAQHYQLAVTVDAGANPFFADPLLLRRTMIFGDHDLAAFSSRLQVTRTVAEP